MDQMSRRAVLGLGAAGLAAGARAEPRAEAKLPEAATIGWPGNAGWDPTRHALPHLQSLYKLVFDQPLDLDPALKLVPAVVRGWTLAADGRSLALELRDDVRFHDGTKLGAADLAWSFFGRARSGQPTALSSAWPWLVGIDTPSPTRAVLRFNAPVPTAPVRLAGVAAFIVPAAAFARLGEAAFSARPVGSGPYRMVDGAGGGRIVLERNEDYWGPKPALRRIAIDIIREPAARLSAIAAGRVDITIDPPAPDMARLATLPGLAAEPLADTRIILLQSRSDQGFADPDIRLAAHHAIDKAALSRAIFGGSTPPISLPAAPGTPGAVADYVFAHDPALARQLLAKSGHGPDRPARIRLGATNGEFPGDIALAQAIMAMWRTVGIEAELEVIEYAKYAALNRADYLPDAMLLAWDNQTGDPALYAGALLNPTQPFCLWRDMALGQKVIDMDTVLDDAARQAGWRALNREAVEIGAMIPLLQAVRNVVHRKRLAYRPWHNGWVLGQTMAWS
jgi:peptide/nickel transport system substrate-binding protein